MSNNARFTDASADLMLIRRSDPTSFSLFGHPARRGARCAMLRQREYRRAARLGRRERVGVNRHEQVRAHAPRLLHAHVERHEEVGVARHHRAHVGLRVDLRAQLLRDIQRDVLFVGAAAADRARILAAVAGVDRDSQQPDRVALALRRGERVAVVAGRRPSSLRAVAAGGGCNGLTGARLCRRRRRSGPAPADAALAAPARRFAAYFSKNGVAVVSRRCRRAAQRRVGRRIFFVQRAVPCARSARAGPSADRVQRPDTGRTRAGTCSCRRAAAVNTCGFTEPLRSNHHPHDMRLILADPHRLNLRIVRRDLRHEVLQRLIEIEAGQVDDEPVRALQQQLLVVRSG